VLGVLITMAHDKKYEIIRFYKDGNRNRRVINRGLTLEEARRHCQDPKTRKEGVYFDGFEEE
jgi:hypothetical protein